jgi:hypothetical protein
MIIDADSLELPRVGWRSHAESWKSLKRLSRR